MFRVRPIGQTSNLAFKKMNYFDFMGRLSTSVKILAGVFVFIMACMVAMGFDIKRVYAKLERGEYEGNNRFDYPHFSAIKIINYGGALPDMFIEKSKGNRFLLIPRELKNLTHKGRVIDDTLFLSFSGSKLPSYPIDPASKSKIYKNQRLELHLPNIKNIDINNVSLNCSCNCLDSSDVSIIVTNKSVFYGDYLATKNLNLSVDYGSTASFSESAKANVLTATLRDNSELTYRGQIKESINMNATDYARIELRGELLKKIKR